MFQKKLRALEIALLISSIIISVISYLNMQLLAGFYPEKSVAYFATMSHTYPFFIGSALAVLLGLGPFKKLFEKLSNRESIARTRLKLTFLIAFISLIILCVNCSFESSFTYKYGFLFASLLTIILILSTRLLHEIAYKNEKEPIFIQHLANISYPMYLFHWPLIIIFSNVFASKAIWVILTLTISYIFSTLLCSVERLFIDLPT